MRIGIGLETGGTIEDVLGRAREAASTGIGSLWASQIFGWDTLTLMALVGREVESVQLGTAVVPIHPRHPAILAAQALTVQATSGGRLTLGIGLSHQLVVEGMWGLSFGKPARYMDEYLSVLLPLLEGRDVNFEGSLIGKVAVGPLETSGASAPSVLVAALAPAMLRLAGGRADGTVTWMVGVKALSEHIVPVISTAAAEAGRRAARVVVSLPVCVTNDREAARQRAARLFSVYGQLPSYRAVLDREGAEGPPDVAVIGDEEDVAEAINQISEAGATEFFGAVYGDHAEVERGRRLLAELASRP